MNISYDSYRVFTMPQSIRVFRELPLRSIITNQMLPESSSDWNLNCIAPCFFVHHWEYA